MGRTSDARERILREAVVLFLTRSYHGVGVDELCAAAGVRKGSFYHHFASKSELLEAVIDHHAAAFAARLDAVEGAPAERLHGVADAIAATQAGFAARLGRAVGCPFGNLAAELSTSDDRVRDHLSGVLDGLEARLAEVCRAAAQAGALRDGVDPARLARALMAQYQGTILLAKVAGTDAGELVPALRAVVAAHVRPVAA